MSRPVKVLGNTLKEISRVLIEANHCENRFFDGNKTPDKNTLKSAEFYKRAYEDLHRSVGRIFKLVADEVCKGLKFKPVDFSYSTNKKNPSVVPGSNEEFEFFDLLFDEANLSKKTIRYLKMCIESYHVIFVASHYDGKFCVRFCDVEECLEFIRTNRLKIDITQILSERH